MSHALRSLLVVAEVATALVVLTGSGLLLRTWITLDRADPGYRAPDALTMQISVPMVAPDGANRYGTQDGLRQFYRDVQREVGLAPRIRNAAWGGVLPLDGTWYMQPFTVEGNAPVPGPPPVASYQMVGAGYFETMEIPLVRGRGFTEADGRDAPPVAIVNEAFARRFLGGRPAIGTRLTVPMMTFGGEPAPVREIVGVARQVLGRPEETVPVPQIYVPNAQNAWYQATLIVRPEDGPPAALLPSVREALRRVDSERPVLRVRTLDAVASEATSRPRFRAALVTSFALLAVVLATVGIFGVLAYSVQQRTREFGVRLALGATAGSIAALVLSGAGRIVATGLAIGLTGAALLSRSISTFLFGVDPVDAATFAGAALVAVTAAAAAVAAPAWRAMRVDPVEAFRSE
jgi:putative ABC transport system permease protein